MNALLRKEIRLLLPSCSMAILITLSLWLAPSNASDPSPLSVIVTLFAFLLCPAVVVMMALDSFGREMFSGNFSNLLAQPVSRSRVWWTKTIVLAGGMILIVAAWWLSFLISQRPALSTSTDSNLRDVVATSVLIPIVAFSGGLWTVLLLRQVAAAFWFTVIVPAALAMMVMYFTEKYGDASSVENNLIVVLVAYSIAGFLWARRMFLRAQDVQWTGGEIAMPEWLKLPRLFVRSRTAQGRRPRIALLTKEFQLHQSQFVIAGVLALLHLGMIAARKAGDGFTDSPTLEFLTGQFWVLWVVMPLLIGCAAVAEERKLGTLETQLCVPARRRTQFVIKFLVVLMLSAVFGVVLPVLFEGRRILPDLHFTVDDNMRGFFVQTQHGMLLLMVATILETISSLLPFLPQLAIVTGVAAISFYASTLARNTLQALAPAVLSIVVASVLIINGNDPEAVINYPLWCGWLVYLIGVPVLTVTLAWLMDWNFKRVLVGWSVWRRNALVFFTSLLSVVTLTSLIYQRVWELVLPIEPTHGAARLTPLQGVTMQTDALGNGGRNFMVRLPEGRIWTERFEIKGPSVGAMLFGDMRYIEFLPGGRFLDGTNWSSFAICNGWEAIGTKSDGSLWVSEPPPEPIRMPQSARLTPDPAKLVRFGEDNNWKSVARENDTSATLLKHDGTLWRLGTNRFSWKKPWPGLRAFELQRLGADADWADIFSDGNETYFRKKNGQPWRFAWKAGAVTNAIRLDDDYFSYPVTDLVYLLLAQGDKWASLSTRGGHNNCMVGVRQDGTFRLTATWELSRNKANWTVTRQNVQIGKETAWLTVAGHGETVVTLKTDGSLWKWTFADDPKTNPDAASCVRLGTHSDWVAVGSVPGEIVSLAADGSLWSWQFERLRYNRSSGFDTWRLLSTSRKPQKIANILNEAK